MGAGEEGCVSEDDKNYVANSDDRDYKSTYMIPHQQILCRVNKTCHNINFGSGNPSEGAKYQI
jgi:hypothetical protein